MGDCKSRKCILSLFLVLISFISYAQTDEYNKCREGADSIFTKLLRPFEQQLNANGILDSIDYYSYYRIYEEFAMGNDVWVEKNYNRFPVIPLERIQEYRDSCFIKAFNDPKDQQRIKALYESMTKINRPSLQNFGKTFINYIHKEDFSQQAWRDMTIILLYGTAVPDSVTIEIPLPKDN